MNEIKLVPKGWNCWFIALEIIHKNNNRLFSLFVEYWPIITLLQKLLRNYLCESGKMCLIQWN